MIFIKDYISYWKKLKSSFTTKNNKNLKTIWYKQEFSSYEIFYRKYKKIIFNYLTSVFRRFVFFNLKNKYNDIRVCIYIK